MTITFRPCEASWRSDLMSIPRACGVYMITNARTGKRYVGSAVDIRQRWRAHLAYMLEGKGSGQKLLVAAWQKYGTSAFTFMILEEVEDVSSLLNVEQKWMDALQPQYNVRRKAESNLGIRFSQPMEPERRRKIGDKTKARLTGKPSFMLGRKHSEAARQKMSATKRALPDRQITFNGESKSLTAWADALGIGVTALGNRLRRKWPLERALTEISRGY